MEENKINYWCGIILQRKWNLLLLLQAHHLTHFWFLINHDCSLLSQRRGNSDCISDYQVLPLLSDFCLVLLNWTELSQTFWAEVFCLTEPFYWFYKAGTQFPLGRVEKSCEQKKCWAQLEVQKGVWGFSTEWLFSLFPQLCVPRANISDTSPSLVPLFVPLSILSAEFRPQSLWWRGDWYYTRHLLRVTGCT